MDRAANLPFRSVLIANRGEIAVRVIRTAHALGMRTIAVYSDADREALHVRLADEAHFIGAAAARESYLDVQRILAVAREAGAEAIHPGYGFLSERVEFAEACAAAGIVFVGPPPAAIRAMGDKAAAKTLMENAGVPVVPGWHGERQDPKFLRQKAYELGYPVLIKAAAGGGGKGMRRVEKAIEFDDALAAAGREAEAAFGDGKVIVEKWIDRPRHIEVQIFADVHGNVVHLFERECSAQRRHQKVVEESPAPGMNDEARNAMTHAAIEAARAVGYTGAGTVEFVASGAGELRNDRFWFMEMNTRLQVEHPVTEAVTGLDLVEWQFRVAAGEKLPNAQGEIARSGHAIEARIYAEDPAQGFLPSAGRLHVLRLPQGEGIRVDTGVEEGQAISSHYDPLIAKVIGHGATRDAALDRLAGALARAKIVGPRTNLGLLRALLAAPEMRSGTMDTGFIERELATLAVATVPDYGAAAYATEEIVRGEQRRVEQRALRRSDERHSPWNTADAFEFGRARETQLSLQLDGEQAKARLHFSSNGLRATVEGTEAAESELIEASGGLVAVRGEGAMFVQAVDAADVAFEHLDAGGVIRAPMHGKVITVEVSAGDRVTRGQRLAVIEAMKMEHSVTAYIAGKVEEIAVEAGSQVAEGARLFVIAADGEP